jgi:streptomycin 6-kinase
VQLRDPSAARPVEKVRDGHQKLAVSVSTMLELPAVVREKALAVGAQAWVDELPALVRAIEADWDICVGRPYRDSTEAFVAEATCSDGRAVVLKLLVPRDRDAAAHEATVLRLADGEGCARLLRENVPRGALLLERLGRSLRELGLPLERRHEILVSVVRRIWRPAPGCGLPTGAEKARRLAEFITTTWDQLDRPCSERAVEHALQCATRRCDAHREETAVLVHGDVHQWNTLQADVGFKLVDPDGLLAEAEYDLGIIMREDPLDGDLRERARRLADRTGLDRDAIWEWGVVERVSTGLLGTRVGLQPIARQMLAAADRLAE